MVRASLVLALILTASTAHAGAFLYAPETVQSDGEGNFSFTAVLIPDGTCLGWAGYCLWGEENVQVQGAGCVDTFCTDPQPVESPVEIDVQGHLTDPTQPGTILVDSAFCTCGGGVTLTTILPAPVPTDDDSWSTLKARYR